MPIVEAVFTSANTGNMSGPKSTLAKMIEAAMGDAVQNCYTNGITDPDKVREAMQAARVDAKERYAKAVAEATSNLAG